MQNNNGVNQNQRINTHFNNGLITNQSNFLSLNRSSANFSDKLDQGFINNKRYRNDDLEMHRSDSSIIKPIDTYIMPQTQSSNFEHTPIEEKKTHYYNQSKDEVETSVNEGSVADKPTNDTNLNQNNQNINSDHLPKLQNIVSTVNLRCVLDLRDIALQARNAEYNPKRFAAVIMRIKEPKTTALIFASGKMVCTGARSEEDSKKAARQYAKIINKLGYSVRFTEFTIQNIVGSCDVRFPIRLEGLAASDNSKFCSYEPEMFPGLIYRMNSPKIVLLIFVSGKIVLTGAKNRDDIFRAYHYILPILRAFKKKETNITPS